LIDNLTNRIPYFFYQTKDRLTYDEINTKTIQLFEKFIAQNIKNQHQKKALI
jgi:ribonuclease P protein component